MVLFWEERVLLRGQEHSLDWLRPQRQFQTSFVSVNVLLIIKV